MITITSDQCQKENVIAELNQKLAKQKISHFLIKNNEYTTVSLIALDYKKLYLKIADSFLDIANVNPYMHIMLFYTDFTHIEITEVD